MSSALRWLNGGLSLEQTAIFLIFDSLLHGVGHQLLFCTLRANNVLTIGYEPLTNHAALATATDETVIVPVTALKGDKASPADACDWLGTCCTPL